MSRLLAIAIPVAIVVAQVCCLPPLEAEMAPMFCPITGQQCETTQPDCDAQPPLATTPATPPPVIAPQVEAIVEPPHAVAHEVRFDVDAGGHEPARTIQLRI